MDLGIGAMLLTCFFGFLNISLSLPTGLTLWITGNRSLLCLDMSIMLGPHKPGLHAAVDHHGCSRMNITSTSR